MFATKDNFMQANSLVSLAAGMIVGAALVLSCSDDSPGNADAATCDCSAAEPAFAGRIMTIEQTAEVAANGSGYAIASCALGALRLTGSCTTAMIRDVTLKQSGFYESGSLPGWVCGFQNNETVPVTIKAAVVCLMPPSQ